ncbi:1-acyl-sn-glycerol-3-phosphate acyltransferase [Suilimivivens aceti]|uniref:1-acyl-sn-glycerol-3-phosphate acyltransferase n=1 Tax=Suilimivivens aceti TaxID=2981774 RepID=A0ABT2T2F4_9FIRM|nr:lysophospholipid acyltransferase family protein [Suilimivivens aceti]MCU6744438.1 1-acyl-sn-glycerol-3-phosphate acyltransferase [Suilimivivens aceti]RHV45714.1 1-acyl-sn-glycerol-3-phosphate acyltransferase [Lachnospiraceae bacterium OM04-12BH]SCH75344.1 1-acyl-sn-glycerol-3-phosphate acyltransferase [uncultured Clostridium sp.]
MIRLILVAVFLVLFLVLGIPLLLIEWVIGKFNQRAKDISSLRIVQWAFKMILFLAGTKVVIKGEENVPKNEPVLYVGNHRSYFDIVITYSRVPDLTGYIAKKEMLRWPLLVNWMKNLHCLFLDRQDVKQGLKTILTAIDKVKAGISICIFPEGTRNRVNDTFMEFHEGSFKVASKSGCAVVPMAIYNSAAIFEDHIPWIRKTTVIVEYGKPFYIKDLPKETQKRVGAYSRDLIMENYFRLKEEAKENGYG